MNGIYQVSSLKTLAALLTVGVLAGCSDSSNIKDLEPDPVPPPPAQAFENPVTVTFESIDVGVLAGTPVSFTLSGTEAANLSITGATMSDAGYTTSGGSVILTRGDGSSTAEFDVELFATADGHFATGMSVYFPASTVEENPEFSVVFTPLAPESDDLAVAAVEETVTTGDDGATTAPITIETPVPADGAPNEDAIAGGAAQLDIPAGVTLTDADGEPVTGNITANVVYFSNEPNGNSSNESALDAFPGGLAPDVILDANGEPDADLADVVFTSAGFTAIQLESDSGQIVSEFSEPIDLSFAVSADSLNPDTGEAIKTGDTIPVWSYDETSGLWSAEGSATVGALDAASNTFAVTKQIDHLSYYNLDFYGQRCRAEITFVESAGVDYAPRVVFTRAGGGWSKGKNIDGMGSHTFLRVPANGEGSVRVLNRIDYSDDLIASAVDADGNAITVQADGSIEANFCSLNGATITIESPDTSELAVDLQSRCTDTEEVVLQPGVVQVFAQPANRLMGTLTPSAGTAAAIRLANGSYQLKGTIVSEALGEQVTFENVNITADDSVTLEFPVNGCETGTPTGGTGGTGAGGDGDGGG